MSQIFHLIFSHDPQNHFTGSCCPLYEEILKGAEGHRDNHIEHSRLPANTTTGVWAGTELDLTAKAASFSYFRLSFEMRMCWLVLSTPWGVSLSRPVGSYVEYINWAIWRPFLIAGRPFPGQGKYAEHKHAMWSAASASWCLGLPGIKDCNSQLGAKITLPSIQLLLLEYFSETVSVCERLTAGKIQQPPRLTS